jgi:hypothetical protein
MGSQDNRVVKIIKFSNYYKTFLSFIYYLPTFTPDKLK